MSKPVPIVNVTDSLRYLCTVLLISLLACSAEPGDAMTGLPATLALPEPDTSGVQPLETLLRQRRSARNYTDTPLALADLGQLLWAAQGITHPLGLRTAPSAGALYPLELHVVAGRIDSLPAGVYHYRPDSHRLRPVQNDDLRQQLGRAALGQMWLADAPAVVVISAVYERTTRKYGSRAARYVHVEAGHAAQNLFLQAGALGLGTVVVGAFEDDTVARLLQLPDDVQPLLLMPVGGR